MVKKFISISLVCVLVQESVSAGLAHPGARVPPAPPRLVTLLQDIHGHLEAQENIQDTLVKILKKNGGRLTVGVEGAAGEFNFSPYRDFPDPVLTQDIGKELLEEGIISGPVLSGLLDSRFTLSGLESPSLYLSNVEAYRRAAPLQQTLKVQIKERRQDLSRQKKAVFTPELLRLDEIVESYRQNKITISEYVETLAKSDPTPRFSIEIFRSARQLEEALAFERVKKERERFVGDLAALFGPDEMEWVRGWSASIEKTPSQISRRFDTLLQAAEAKGLKAKRYPLLLDYVRYLKLTEGIDGEKLLKDLREMEEDRLLQLTEGTPRAREIVRASRQLYLTEKLIKFELTPEEWEEYKSVRNPEGGIRTRFNGNPSTFKSFPDSEFQIPDLEVFKSFYEAADARNEAMVEGVLRSKTEVFVAGGFHTPGVKELLEQKGIKVEIIRPTITRVESADGSAYLNIFARKKTPLQNLLLRWKLFLAPPISMGVEPLTATRQGSARDRFATRYRQRVSPKLRAAAERASKRLFEKSRQIPWLTETVALVAPMALAVITRHYLLAQGAAVIGPVILAIAHRKPDKGLHGPELWDRLAGRFLWGALFNLSFLGIYAILTSAGLPVWFSASVGLISSVLLHLANHRAVLRPPSYPGSLLFGKFHLPPILMSVVGTEGSDELTPIRQEARDNIQKALAEWRATDKYLDKKTTKQVKQDAVTRLFEEYSIRTFHMEGRDCLQAILGLSESLSSMTKREIEVRSYRDQWNTFERGVNLPPALEGNDLTKWRLHNSKFSQDVTKSLAAFVNQKYVEDIVKENMEALRDFNRGLLRAAVTEWRQARGYGADISISDENFRKIWKYLSGEFFVIEYFQLAAADLNRELRVEGMLMGLLSSDLTPEETRHRISVDLSECMLGFNRYETESILIQKVYTKLRDHYKEKNREAEAAAAFQGFYQTFERYAARAAKRAYDHWKGSSDSRHLSAFGPLIDDLWKLLNITEKDPEVKKDIHDYSRKGLLDAIVSMDLDPNHFRLFLGAELIQAAKWTNPHEKPGERAKFVVELFHEASEDPRSAGRFGEAFKEQIGSSLVQFTRIITEQEIRFRRMAWADAETYPFDIVPLPGFPVLYDPVEEWNLVDQVVIVDAVAEVYRSSNLTTTEMDKLIQETLEIALRETLLSPVLRWRAQILLDVYEKIGEELPQAVDTVGKAVETKLDISRDYKEAVEKRIAGLRGGKEDEFHDGHLAVNDVVQRYGFLLALLTNPRFKIVTRRMTDVIVNAEYMFAELVEHLVYEVTFVINAVVSTKVSPRVRDWSHRILEAALNKVTDLHRAVANHYRAEGDLEKAQAIDDLIKIREKAARSVEEGVRAWRTEPDSLDPDKTGDAMTTRMPAFAHFYSKLGAHQRRNYLFGLLAGYRRAQLTSDEIAIRFKRDVVSIITAEMSTEEETLVFGSLASHLVGDYARFLTGEEDLENLNKGFNDGVKTAVKNLTREGISEWREAYKNSGQMESGNNKMKRVFSMVRTGLTVDKQISRAAFIAMEEAFADANLTPDEVFYRVGHDVADETLVIDADPMVETLSLAFYRHLGKRHFPDKAGQKDPRTEQITKGYYTHFGVVAHREAERAIRKWREAASEIDSTHPENHPLIGFEDQAHSLIGKGKFSAEESRQILTTIYENIALALKTTDVNPAEFEDLFLKHMTSALAAWFHRGAAEIENLRFVSDLYHHYAERLQDKPEMAGLVRKVQEEAFRYAARLALQEEIKEFREGYSSLPDRPQSLYAAFVQIYDQFGLSKARLVEDWVDKYLMLNLSSAEYGAFMDQTFAKVTEESRQGFYGEEAFLFFTDVSKRLMVREGERGREAERRTIQDSFVKMTEVAEPIRRALKAWEENGDREGDGLKEKPDALVQDSLARLTVVTRLSEDTAKEKKDSLVAVLRDAELTRDELFHRAKRDVEYVITQWSRREINPRAADWNNRLLGNDVAAVTRVYTALAERYRVEGKTLLAGSIVQGILKGMLNPFSNNDFAERARWVFVPIFIQFAHSAVSLGTPADALIALANVQQLMEPGYEAKDYIRDISLAFGKAYQEQSTWGESLEEGFELVNSIDSNALSVQTADLSRWAEFFNNTYVMANIQYALGLYQTAERYISYGLNLLEKYPQLQRANAMSNNVIDRLKGLHAACLLQMEGDVSALPGHIDVIENNFDSLINKKSLSVTIVESLRWILQGAYIRACRTGNESYYARLQNVFILSKDDKENRRLYNAVHGEALTNLGLGTDADHAKKYFDRARLFFEGEDPNQIEMRDLQDVLFMLAYAHFVLATGTKEEALKIYGNIYSQLAEADRAGIGDINHSFLLMRRVTLTVAAIQSTLPGEDAAAKTADRLKKATWVPVYETKWMDDFGVFSGLQEFDPETIFQAVDRILSVKSRDGLPFMARLLLFRFLKRIYPKEIPKDFAGRWTDLMRRSKTMADETLWPNELKMFIRKYLKSEIDAALSENLDEVFNRNEVWPGRAYLQTAFVKICVRMDVRFRESLEAGNVKAWLQKFSRMRAKIYYLAGVYALAGFPEESRLLLNMATTFGEQGAMKFLGDKNRINRKDIEALVVYPVMGGDVWLGIRNGIELMKSSRQIEADTIRNLFIWAANSFGMISWNSPAEMTHAANRVIKVLQDLLAGPEKESPTWSPILHSLLSCFYLIVGIPLKARESMKTSALEAAAAMSGNEAGGNSSILLNWAPYALSDINLPLFRRLEEVEKLVSLSMSAAPQGAGAVYARYRGLLNNLMKYRNIPDHMREVGNQLIGFLQEDDVNRQMPELIEAGLPFHLVETAALAGFDTEEASDIESSLKILRDVWVGDFADLLLELAQRLFAALKSEEPSSFIEWTDTINPKRLKWPGHKTILRMTAAAFLPAISSDRAGGAVEPDWRKAILEAQEMLNNKTPYHTDEFHTAKIAEVLMDSPLARESFIDITMAALKDFDPELWQNTPEGKNKPDSLKRFLVVAMKLGSPRVLVAFDEAAANRRFPLRDALKGENGLIAQLEPALTGEDWITRVNLRSTMTEEEIQAVSNRASALAEFTGDEKVRFEAAIAGKREAHLEKSKIHNALSEATRLYHGFYFMEALAELNSIQRDLWTRELSDLEGKITAAHSVWSVYQKGRFEEALKMIPEHNGGWKEADPALVELKDRLVRLFQFDDHFQNRRLQKADDAIKGINKGEKTEPTDRPLEEARKKISAALAEGEKAFEDVKSLMNRFGESRESDLQLRRRARFAFRNNAENFELMNYLIEQAKQFMSDKKFTTAQEVLHVLLVEGKFWREGRGERELYRAIANEAEQLRMLARAKEVKNWLSIQADILNAQVEAEAYLAAESAEERGFKGKTFYFEGNWEINSLGMFYLKRIYEEDKAAIKRLDDGNHVRLKPVDIPTSLEIPSGFSFSVNLQWNGGSIRVPMTFVRYVKAIDDEGFLFQPDTYGIEQLRKVAEMEVPTKGTLVYIEDMPTVSQFMALDRVINYVRTSILDLEHGRKRSEVNPILDRIFGLDINAQQSKGKFYVDLDLKFRDDPSQNSAIRAGLELEVVGIQGPPGTGKTTTAAHMYKHALSVLKGEDIKTLVSSRNGQRKGDIVVLTAQAHAGVDNMALKLQEENVPIIRSASQQASVNIAHQLKRLYENRLHLLWGLIQRHYLTGEGFAYLATNNGLLGDHKCLVLLQMYLNGAPMSEIELRYRYMTGSAGLNGIQWQFEDVTNDRQPIQPVWGQEEAGQASTAETMVVYFAIRPYRCCFFGDQYQLPPHGIDDWAELIVHQANRRGFQAASGSVKKIFSGEALEAMATSLFEVMYSYAERWSRKVGNAFIGGSINTQFLSIARRSHWLITEVVNLFYNGRLIHRDVKKPREKWEKIDPDTIMVIETDGQEETGGKGEMERGDEGGMDEKSKSKRNMREAGMIIRTVTYYLNVISNKTKDLHQPKDILILTPYKAQNHLINDLLIVTAVLNDMAKGETVKQQEFEQVERIIHRHIRDRRGPHREWKQSIERLLDQLKRANHASGKPVLVGRLFESLKYLYDLTSDDDRKLRREDIKPLLTPPEPKKKEGALPLWLRERAEETDTLDKQEQNFLKAKTVHRVQGQERRVVVVSLVRSGEKVGFLAGRRGDRILNVALSRAQDKLAIIASRGLKLGRFNQIKRRIKELWDDFEVKEKAPTAYNDRNGNQPASLRSAWNVASGSSALDRHIDVFAAPGLETAAFLSVLAMGLSSGDSVLVASGLVFQIFIFPALHILSPSNKGDSSVRRYNWGYELRFSALLTVFYLMTWTLQVLIMPGAGWHPEWIGMVPIALAHFYRNWAANTGTPDSAGAERDLLRILPVTKQGVGGIDGLDETGRRPLHFDVPSAGREAVLNPSAIHRRRALSGA